MTTPTLTVPHPHLWYRRFVLDPLVEMAPQFVHPIHQATIAELHSQLLARPLPCMLLGGSDGARTELQQELNHLPASLRGEVVWCDAGQHQARIVFCLQPAGIPASVSPARCINLWTFPTPPLETVRDVLTAALDSARIVEH